MLTVWRTLHLELDTMEGPDLADQLLGDFDEGEDDPLPGEDLPTPPWALFPSRFASANVDVVADLAPYESISGPKEKADFEHYFGDDWMAATTTDFGVATAESVRNVRSEDAFWVVQLMYGYDYARNVDHDDNLETFVLGMGIRAGQDGPAYTLFETIRDVAAHEPSVGAGITYEMLLERVSLHEATHKFDMRHSDTGGWK